MRCPLSLNTTSLVISAAARSTARRAQPAFVFARASSLAVHSGATTAASASASASTSPGRAFFRSDTALLSNLHRRQLRYRLELASPASPPATATDRQEAHDLASSEVRWIEQEVRSSSPPPPPSASASAIPPALLSRDQRRRLIWMARQMTRSHQPISYVLGHHPFSDLPSELLVRPPCLIPRPETEEWAAQVADAVADRLASQLCESSSSSKPTPPFRILDLCTGSGCVAVLLAHTLRKRLGDSGWHVTACDLATEAVELARDNAERIGIPPGRIAVQQGDVFSDADMKSLLACAEDANGKPFDLVVCNPPYIPRSEWEKLEPSVKLWEDPRALIGERNGLKADGDDSANNNANANAEGKGRGRARGKGKGKSTTAPHDGLDFYKRLHQLVNDPSFVAPPRVDPSGSGQRLPRLVVEFGKGQHAAVQRILASPAAPAPALAPGDGAAKPATTPQPRRIVRISQKLLVVGLGNYTHPLTRHSVGQLLLEHLPKQLHRYDAEVRAQLEREAERRERRRSRAEAESGEAVAKYDLEERQTMRRPLEMAMVVPFEAEGAEEAEEARPLPPLAEAAATWVSDRTVRGWTTTVPLLVDPNPAKGRSLRSDPPLPMVQVDVVLYKPRYLMNESGKGVAKALSHFSITSPPSSSSSLERYANLLLLHDELSRPFGKVSRKDRGSAAGHNGVRSCFSSLSVRDIDGETLSRLRIGIGKAEDATWLGKRLDTARWVLSPLREEEVVACAPDTGAASEASPGEVLEITTRQVVEWVKERVRVRLGAGACGEKEHEGQRVELRKDAFGVVRTAWLV
ncbi:hypothetical protein ACQY0O_002078 [Thecaphora frezii]